MTLHVIVQMYHPLLKMKDALFIYLFSPSAFANCLCASLHCYVLASRPPSA